MIINEKFNLSGCPIEAVNIPDAKLKLKKLYANETSGYSVAINAEKIYLYNKNVHFKNVIKNSIFPFPDGFMSVIGLRLKYSKKVEKINMPKLGLEFANEVKAKILLIGASPDVNKMATRNIKERYPNLLIEQSIDGYRDEEEIMKIINRSESKLAFLAMGSPKQEIMAKKIISSGKKIFCIGCGGAFDVMAGKVNRAPKFFIDNGLEWIYRIYKQPSRLFRLNRLIHSLLSIFCNIIMYKLKQHNQ